MSEYTDLCGLMSITTYGMKEQTVCGSEKLGKTACEEVVSYKIRCGKVAPPKQRSAGMAGPATLQLCKDHIIIKIRVAPRFEFLYACLATAITVIIVGVLTGFNGMAWRWSLLSCLGWGLLFGDIMSREKSFLIDSQFSSACYMQKRRIACLQLPTDDWIAIKAERERDHAPLLESLHSIYGKRMEFGK